MYCMRHWRAFVASSLAARMLGMVASDSDHVYPAKIPDETGPMTLAKVSRSIGYDKGQDDGVS